MAIWKRDPEPHFPGDTTWIQYPRDGWRGCSGSIIATRYVVTSGHCIIVQQEYKDQGIIGTVYPEDRVAVRLGDHNIGEYGDTLLEEYFNVNDYYYYSDYAGGQGFDGSVIGGHYDIAILQLDRDIPPHKFVPVCLARFGDKVYGGEQINLAGWGMVSEYPNPPHQNTTEPYEVKVSVIDPDTCDSQINKDGKF